MTLGEWLRQRRTEAGLRQVDVAARLEVHQVTVSQWETDRNAVSVATLAALCELYDVPEERRGEALSLVAS